MARERHKIKFQISDKVVNTTEAIAQYQDVPAQTVQVNAWRLGVLWVSFDQFIGESIEPIELEGEELPQVSITVPEVQYQRLCNIAEAVNLRVSEMNQICLCRGVEILRRVTAFEQKISEVG